jgi:hypothetical protein
MKIFDCFMFYNEFDILELRLRELYDHVDVFVIVESDCSHTCNKKSYKLEQHLLARYAQWQDKIRYVKHTSPASPDPWINENAQRNDIQQGIHDADDEDIIIVSDVDEIIRASSVDYIRQTNQALIYGFHMPLFNFKFNYIRIDPGPYDIWAMAARYHWVKQFSPQMLRNQRANLTKLPFKVKCQRKSKTYPEIFVLDTQNVYVMEHGGWHFSYLGDNDWLHEKAMNNCHQEDITPEFINQLDMNKSIAEKKSWNRDWPYVYEIVNLTDYFPKSCQDYPQFCLPDSGIDPMQLLIQHET